MKTRIALLIACIASLSLLTLTQCGDDPKPDNTDSAVVVDYVIPVDLPTNIVPGFNFPEDSNTIYQWVSTAEFDSASIYAHAWGIWAGLTANSGEVYQGDTLLVYETWLGIGEIRSILTDTGFKANSFDEKQLKTGRTALTAPHQFGHGGALSENIDSVFSNNFFVSVSYNNAAAVFALEHSILNQSVLNSYYHPNALGAIPAFPNDAITLKPTYFAAKPHGNLIRISVWPGEPGTPKSYPSGAWNNYIFADTSNSQQPGKALTPIADGVTDPQQIANATCNLSDFIYFELDSAMAAYMNQEQAGQASGWDQHDIAILMCMHVATKEISNWTWQTFYWDPNPSGPKFPGTNLSKPSQLSAQASHYSASTAYAMLAPNQPISGGSNDPALKPVIGFNPYLEAVFGPGTFDSVPNAHIASFQYGMQTNCMSCHALANYSPNVSIPDQSNNPLYSTDQYIDMSDPKLFNSRVQLDFAWSIIGNVIPDTTSNVK